MPTRRSHERRPVRLPVVNLLELGWSGPPTGLVAGAVVFGTCLAVRTSPWLIPLDVLAIGGRLVLAASLGREGSLFDLTVPAVVVGLACAFTTVVALPSGPSGGVDRAGLGGCPLRCLRHLQLIALSGGGLHLLETAGLTYAE